MSRVPFEEDRKYQSKVKNTGTLSVQLNICVSIVLENNQLSSIKITYTNI